MLVPGWIGGEPGVVDLHQGLAAQWDVSRTLICRIAYGPP